MVKIVPITREANSRIQSAVAKQHANDAEKIAFAKRVQKTIDKRKEVKHD